MVHEIPLGDVISTGPNSFDVVKIDAEGAELDIVEMCTTWGSTRLLLLEYSTQRCRDDNVGHVRFLRALRNLSVCGFSHAYIPRHMLESVHWTHKARVWPGRDDNVCFYRSGKDSRDLWKASTREFECRMEQHIADLEKLGNA